MRKIKTLKYKTRDGKGNEITMLYNDAIIRNGQVFHYKQMYPDFFTWLESRWGKIYA